MPTKKATTKGRKQASTVPARQKYSKPTKFARTLVNGGYRGTAAFEQVCSLTDPFCAAARGAKVPDDDSTPSMAISLRGFFTATTDASGSFAVSVRPNPSACFRPSTAITGTTVTTWGSYQAFGDYTAFAAVASRYRIASWGVRVYPTMAPTDQSGYIKFMVTQEEMANGTTTNGGLFQTVEVYPTANSDVHWVSTPTGTTWKEYKDLTVTSDWTQLTVFGQGLPATFTAAVIVEVYMNIEYTVDFGTISAGSAEAAAQSNPVVLRAANHVYSRANPLHAGGSSAVTSTIARLAREALGEVASAAIPYFGNTISKLLKGTGQMSRQQQRYLMVD